MKNRFKTVSGMLVLTFMLLFGALAFARSANAAIANPNMGSAGLAAPQGIRLEFGRGRRHHREWRRYHRNWRRGMYR